MEEALDIQFLLRNTYLFKSLNEDELRVLIGHAKTIELKPNQVILKEGDKGDSMYVILSGEVQIMTSTGEGEQICLAHLEAGHFFGEQAILPNQQENKRNATVMAIQSCKLLQISSADFQAMIQRNTGLITELKKMGEEQARQKLVGLLFR